MWMELSSLREGAGLRKEPYRYKWEGKVAEDSRLESSKRGCQRTEEEQSWVTGTRTGARREHSIILAFPRERGPPGHTVSWCPKAAAGG